MTSRRALWFLLMVIGAQVLLHGAWFAMDRSPAYWDQHRYFLMTRTAISGLRGEEGGALFDLHESHAPLYPLLGAITSFVTGAEFRSLRTLNLLLAPLFTLAVFLLGSCFTTRSVAVFAAALAAFLPYGFRFSHLYYCENLLLPLVALTLWATVRSDQFKKLPWALLAGLFAGLGLLTKWTFPIYVGVPMMVYALKGRRFVGPAITLLAILVIAGPWYQSHLAGFLEFTGKGVTSGEGHLNAVNGLRGLLFYPTTLATRVLGVPLALATLYAAWRTLRVRPVHGTVTLLPLVVTCSLFTLVLTKGERHILPAVPLMMIAVAAAIWPLKRRGVLATALLAYAVLASVATSFPLPGMGKDGPNRWVILVERSETAPWLPLTRQWPDDAIVRVLSQRHRDHPHVLVLFNYGLDFRQETFDTPALERNIPISFEIVPLFFPHALEPTHRFPLDALQRSDFLIAKTGNLWVRYKGAVPVHRHGAHITDALTDPRAPLASAFTLLSTHPLPDGSLALVYERSRGPEADRAVARLALRFDPFHKEAWKMLLGAVPSGDLAAAARERGVSTLHAEDPAAVLREDPLDENAWQALDSSPAGSSIARRFLSLLERRRTGERPEEDAVRLLEFLQDTEGPQGTVGPPFSKSGKDRALLTLARQALETHRDTEPTVRRILADLGVPLNDAPLLPQLRVLEAAR